MKTLLLMALITFSTLTLASIEGIVVLTEINQQESICETHIVNTESNNKFIITEELTDCFYTRKFKAGDKILIERELTLEQTYFSLDGDIFEYYSEQD